MFSQVVLFVLYFFHSEFLPALATDKLCGVSSTSGTIGSSNICVAALNQPYCVNLNDSNPAATPTFVCRECFSNCDCGRYYYCIKSPGPLRGTCALMDPKSLIVGQPCNVFTSPPIKAVNDRLVCGIPYFNSTDNIFLFYEWIGACSEGTCRICIDGDIASQTVQGSIMCPGRDCIGGLLRDHLTVPWLASYNIDLPTGINASILFFVIVITLASSVMCICSIKSGCSGRKYKKVTQKL